MECPGCGKYGPPDPETGYDADELCPDCKETQLEIRDEEQRVQKLVTVEEIFEAGFKRGLERAGLTSSHDESYKNWLLDRKRGRR